MMALRDVVLSALRFVGDLLFFKKVNVLEGGNEITNVYYGEYRFFLFNQSLNIVTAKKVEDCGNQIIFHAKMQIRKY